MFHIAFEGIDNAGKTTIADCLQRRLLEKGSKVVVTKELTSKVGEIILKHFEEDVKLSPKLKTYLFAADRLIRFEKIISEQHDIVIWDRYVYSALVYREMEKLDVKWVEKVNSIFPVANLTYYIDIEPSKAWERGKSAKKSCPYNIGELSFCREIYKRYVNSGEMIEIFSQEQKLDLMTDKIMEDMVKRYE
jgi:dTMP kinase